MNWPRITIVTPSFNQAPFLEETLRSVLDQGYPNLEYIVVDGGSRDGSVEILRQYGPRLAWWVSEADRGQADAINKGLIRATGSVYGYLNSDDLLEPGALAQVGRCFAHGAQWIASPVRCFGSGRPEWTYEARPEQTVADWLWQCPIPQQGTFWSSALTRRFGLFRPDLRYALDYEYWLRLRLRGGIRPHIVQTRLGAFRFHDASKTVSQMQAFWPEERRVRAEYRRLLPWRLRGRTWLLERYGRADKLQALALTELRQGRRLAGLRTAAASLVWWPPMGLARRTTGLLMPAAGWKAVES